MSSVYPYRECECGRQIHVGGVPYCDHCQAIAAARALVEIIQ